MDIPFKRVTEATYLATEKSDKYRAILRYFYIQHERLKEYLLPEEILSHLKSYSYFLEYTLDELHGDLTSLVKWGNLFAQQESGKVKTIEEFQRRRFRYQITPYTVEFERMLMRFEQESESFGGSLEKTQFERFYQAIKKIPDLLGDTPENCRQHWDDILTYFKKITQNTSDYFAYLRSEEATEHMKSDAFFMYKEQFTNYLRDFIRALLRTAAAIQDVMEELSNEQMHVFFTKVALHEEQVFRFEQQKGEDFLQELDFTWKNMKEWFLGDGSGMSQYENVLNQTTEAIRQLTRIVQRLGERSQIAQSRKEDYLYLAEWFLRLSDLNEAHKLSSVVFGAFHTKHLYCNHYPTDDIYMDTWEEMPMIHEREPRIMTYRKKTKATALENQQELKEKTKAAYIKRQLEEKKIIESYRTGNSILIEELPLVEAFVRKLFLSWIGKAMTRQDRIIKTEYGDLLKVDIDLERKVVLKAKDGNITMPAVCFHYLEKGGQS